MQRRHQAVALAEEADEKWPAHVDLTQTPPDSCANSLLMCLGALDSCACGTDDILICDSISCYSFPMINVYVQLRMSATLLNASW